MAADTNRQYDADDLDIPFIFVPHGDPKPTEWMARHSGWVKLPAVMVPRSTSPQQSPIHPTAATVLAAAPAAAAEGSEFSAAIAAAGIELAGLGLLAAWLLKEALTIKPLEPNPPNMRQDTREAHSAAGAEEALIPGQSDSRLPGLIPPSIGETKPKEGGPIPIPASPLVLGGTPPEPSPTIIPGHPATPNAPIILHQKRNAGLKGGARTYSGRARKAAELADPKVPEILSSVEWEAHHLITIAGIRVVPNVIGAAVRAGWKTDGAGNVVPLPASPEAQRKLQEAGVNCPLHNSGHGDWNAEAADKLQDISRQLQRENLKINSKEYDHHAKDLLENLERELRNEMLKQRRITDNISKISTLT